MSFVWLLSNPYPKIWQLLQCNTYDFAHNITISLDIPAIFVFCMIFEVIDEIMMLFAAKTVLSNLVLGWKQNIVAFLKLTAEVSMTPGHPGNRKTWSCFVPQDETNV